MISSSRHKLRFLTLEDLREQVLLIKPDSHRTLGNWSIAQNFYHLAAAFEGSVDGLPAGFPKTFRRLARPFRWFITQYRFPPFLPIPSAIRFKLEPAADADFEVQKLRLLQSILRFEEFAGLHPPHPVLGPLTRDEWIGFHLRHCQHHLSFVTSSRDSSGSR